MSMEALHQVAIDLIFVELDTDHQADGEQAMDWKGIHNLRWVRERSSNPPLSVLLHASVHFCSPKCNGLVLGVMALESCT